MLRYKLIDRNNINLATKLELEIFPRECAYIAYLKSILMPNEMIYYIVYRYEIPIGITGLYIYDDAVWLGWYGVLKEYRLHGFGREILEDSYKFAQSLARKNNIKYFRLYTSTVDNPEAQFLYRKFMDIEEIYNNELDTDYKDTLRVYTKVFNDNNITKWNNRFLDLKTGDIDLEKGMKIYLNNIKEYN